VPLRIGEEVQEMLRRGDGELIFNKLAIYSTTQRSVLPGLTSTALRRNEKNWARMETIEGALSRVRRSTPQLACGSEVRLKVRLFRFALSGFRTILRAFEVTDNWGG
jgi:hypothetical protein